MKTVQKGLVLSRVGAIGVIAVLFMAMASRHRHHTGRCEKAGRDIDERLKESKAALDKAIAHVQSAYEHIKNRKP